MERKIRDGIYVSEEDKVAVILRDTDRVILKAQRAKARGLTRSLRMRLAQVAEEYREFRACQRRQIELAERFQRLIVDLESAQKGNLTARRLANPRRRLRLVAGETLASSSGTAVIQTQGVLRCDPRESTQARHSETPPDEAG